MDFKTIENKFKNCEYSSPLDFACDVDQIYINCTTYNHKGSEICEMALKMQEVFEMEYAKIPKIGSKKGCKR